MKPLGATTLALVGAVVLAGATAQLGAAKDFPDPRWTFATSNNQFLVYACDGSDTDCTKRGPTTEGAAEKAHVYCSHPTRLDKNGLLEWTRSTFRLGGDDEVFKTFETFSVVQAAGKWASVPSPEEEYTTGTGGWVFSSISCGSGVRAPIGQGEDVVTATFSGTRKWMRPLRPGRDWLVKQFVKGRLQIGGEIKDSPRFSPGNRRILFAGKGNPSGFVRVVNTYRRCRDAACDIRRIFKRTTSLRMGGGSSGRWILAERDQFKFRFKPERTEQVLAFAAEVQRSQIPGCRRGPSKRARVAVIDHRVKGGAPFTQDLIAVVFCGEKAGISQVSKGGPNDNGTASVTFRVRDNEQPLPISTALSEMG